MFRASQTPRRSSTRSGDEPAVGYDVLRMAMAKCRDVVGRSRQHAAASLLHSRCDVFTNAEARVSIIFHQHPVPQTAASSLTLHGGASRCSPGVTPPLSGTAAVGRSLAKRNDYNKATQKEAYKSTNRALAVKSTPSPLERLTLGLEECPVPSPPIRL
jgi:hypothetical protein